MVKPGLSPYLGDSAEFISRSMPAPSMLDDPDSKQLRLELTSDTDTFKQTEIVSLQLDLVNIHKYPLYLNTRYSSKQN